MTLPSCGRGKKAPYKSQMYRIPTPIRPVVERLGEAYRLSVEGSLDPQGRQLLEKVESAMLKAVALWTIASSTSPSNKLDIKNSQIDKPDIKNELDQEEPEEDEEELDEAEDLEQVIRDQAKKLQDFNS